MNDNEILSRLTIIMRSTFRDPELVAVPAMTADDVDGWDSLSHALFLMKVERAFEVRFPTNLAVEMRDVKDLVALLHDRLVDDEKRA